MLPEMGVEEAKMGFSVLIKLNVPLRLAFISQYLIGELNYSFMSRQQNG